MANSNNLEQSVQSLPLQSYYNSENFNDERNVEITLSPWILLTEDKEMTVPKEWVITIVNPIESITKMYQEKIDG